MMSKTQRCRRCRNEVIPELAAWASIHMQRDNGYLEDHKIGYLCDLCRVEFLNRCTVWRYERGISLPESEEE
jgi:hypothetical protein